MRFISNQEWLDVQERLERLENQGEHYVSLPCNSDMFLFNVKVSEAIVGIVKRLGLKWTEAGFEPKGKK